MTKLKIKWLIYFQIYFILFSNFFITVLHVPSAIKYISDIITACLLVLMLTKKSKVFTKNNYQKYINCTIILFFAYCIINSIMHGVNPLYLAWAIRVTFRFYIFYIACVRYLVFDDVRKILLSFEKIYIINIIVVLYQFIVLGLRQDFLGGIFGIETGSNGYMNIFFILMLSYEMNKYYLKELKLSKFIFYILTMLAMAGMAELKFFYVESIIIILLVLLVNKPSKKTLVFVITSMVAFFIGIQVLKSEFPEAYAMLMDKESIDNYLSAGWTNGKEIARTTAIPMINNNFFDGKTSNMLFGLGFGNCEYSKFFQTPFAMMYSDTKYRNFTYAMQYLETGYVGLILYMLFFVTNFIGLLRYKFTKEKKIYANFLKIFIVMVGINTWYGGTNKEDIAYIIFLCMSIFGIILKDNLKKYDEIIEK